MPLASSVGSLVLSVACYLDNCRIRLQPAMFWFGAVASDELLRISGKSGQRPKIFGSVEVVWMYRFTLVRGRLNVLVFVGFFTVSRMTMFLVNGTLLPRFQKTK